MQNLPEDDCFAIRQASRYVSQIYDRQLAQVGMTITQFSILTRLYRLGRLTMRELAAYMLMDRTSVLRALQPLRRDGSVDDRAEAGRMLTIGLTEHGVTRLAAARKHWRAAQDEFERHFGVERAQALRRELFEMTQE